LVVTQDCFHAVAFVARLAPRGRGSFLPRSGRGLSPCARNTIREAISRDTRSSQPSMYAAHAARRNRTRNAAGTFSRSAEDLQTEKCGWPNLSTRRQRAARPTPRSHEPSGHTLTLDPPCLQGRHRLRNTTYYGRPPLTGLGRNFLPFEILRDETATRRPLFSPLRILDSHRNRRVTVTVATRVQILFMKLIALLGLLPAAAALGYCNDKDSSCAHWGSKGESAWSSCPLGSAPARPLRLLRALLAALAGAALPGERPAHWAPDSSEPQGRRLHRL
jgi:hypothetical protein